MSQSPLPVPHDEDTKPSHTLPFDPKVYGLLVAEEQARAEISENISMILREEKLSDSTAELLSTFRDYMTGVKELGDLLKQ